MISTLTDLGITKSTIRKAERIRKMNRINQDEFWNGLIIQALFDEVQRSRKK